MNRPSRTATSPRARRTLPVRPTPCEVVVADARRARRLVLTRTPRGTLHVEERARLDEHWDEKQHHRPYMLSAHGRNMASAGHERDERLQRFGRDLAAWLERAPATDGRLPVLLPAPMLGALRKAARASLMRRLELRERDLGCLNLTELAAHRELGALLPPAED